VLGYGGFGLALKYTHTSGPTATPRDFVVKVSMKSWEDKDIRREEKETRVK
jgi:hypothetical protein